MRFLVVATVVLLLFLFVAVAIDGSELALSNWDCSFSLFWFEVFSEYFPELLADFGTLSFGDESTAVDVVEDKFSVLLEVQFLLLDFKALADESFSPVWRFSLLFMVREIPGL